METGTERTNEIIDGLNSLLRGEISAVETYKSALERIKDARLRPTLEENRRLHQVRCDLLRSRIQRLGGTPAESSGAWGSFARLIEGSAKLLGVKTAITALEEGEDHGIRDYRDAVRHLDVESRQFVESQLLTGQEQTHRAMSSLKHTLH
jgi:hypothetical protein